MPPAPPKLCSSGSDYIRLLKNTVYHLIRIRATLRIPSTGIMTIQKYGTFTRVGRIRRLATFENWSHWYKLEN
jgi:hypothetical protein